LSLSPFTMMCAKYLFWLVNRPRISSTPIPNDAFSSSIRN
jgi:hypothetical protein